MAKRRKPKEVLIVHQGFERGTIANISDFKMDDFRGQSLPHFHPPYNLQFRGYYRIEILEPDSHCPWGKSRWVPGPRGKLKMLDENWDSSG